MKVAILGSGAWGTAVASHVARRHDTLLWARDATLLEAMRASGENTAYLPGCRLTPALAFEADLGAALRHAAADDALCILATPVAGLRALCRTMQELGAVPRHFIWLCKGLEADTHLLPHQVVADVLGDDVSAGVVTGPSFAREVALGRPVALTAVSTAPCCSARALQALHHEAVRIYTGDDVTGAEVGGAVKNVLAIATGIGDGLGLGLNARAALVTRGLAEMTRLGLALGARAETFTGLAGVGDLILTATGDLSRNRTVGLGLARGESLAGILGGLGHVAEGVRCALAVRELAAIHHVDMPITEAVCEVLLHGRAPRDAVASLLGRDAKPEAQS